ncbi:hypothetical protein J3R83DRAFT_9562 [Lanmaoa asiatica]|nr:hypothetical protein J3R83DRAFT_9562 [Lanmaoa asiatica]
MPQAVVFYVRFTANVVMALGLLLTAWRIYFRLKIGRFWWEDAFAAILLVTGLSWNITSWIYLLTNDLTSIVVSWFETIGFTCIVTLARMSLLFSVIRIIHGNPRLLKFTYACATFFVASCLIQIVERTSQCALHPGRQQKKGVSLKPACAVSEQFSIFEFTTDCISVSILVVLPLCMLWKVKLPRRQRRMILSIFASSVVLAFGAACRAVGRALGIFIMTSVGFNAEITLSFIVCNLLVGVTYAYRFLLHDNGEATETTEDTSDDDDFTTRLPTQTSATTFRLTTVDLEVSLSGQQSSIILEEKTV